MVRVLENKNIKIIALTDAGHRLASRLKKRLDNTDVTSEVWFKPKPFSEKVQNAFSAGDPLILICATGIAVRTLAPVIQSKHDDPPVLVLDELGEFVIPLLSGHEGGANAWAEDIATILDAQLVITTAKPYLKPVYTVGMGCERHCPEEELNTLLTQCLVQAGITMDQVASINSIDIKSDELGLIELAKTLGKPYGTFDKQSLSSVEHLLSTKSDYVFEIVGVYGVAESAALYAAQKITGDTAELILNKQKTSKATCAIAKSYPIE